MARGNLKIPPPEIRELENPRVTTNCNNSLNHIPVEIRKLKKLRRLSFALNQIRTLPPWTEN